MYEILFDVLLRTKILAPPLLSPPNIRVQETPWLRRTSGAREQTVERETESEDRQRVDKR